MNIIYIVKNKIVYISMLVLMVWTGIHAQEQYKDEMRATWVATVANIDWPKSADRGNQEAQKADLIAMLDLYQELNFNAIFLQVRTECDAFYQSAYEPWSRYLSTFQGDDPGYDPLQFALEEGHKRGIEVHAWINPYRLNASAYAEDSYYHSTHIYKEHPEWAIVYPSSGKNILNPGLPEVISYIGSVVRDILENYQVDGVHLDDYFYAYGGTDNALDQAAYDLYGAGMTRGDWRRDNVNRMIDTVYRVIQEVNPSVRFGVSPFGIYRPGVPPGIAGMDAYTTIYCDPLAWLKDGTVDYLTPQLYWPTGGAQDFETLANWWSETLSEHDRHFYPGQGTYRLPVSPGLKSAPSDKNQLHESKWYMDLDLSQMESGLLKGTSDPVSEWTLGEIGKQIDIVRSLHAKNGLGSVFFSAKDFTRVNGLADYLKDNKYTHPTLAPEMWWKPDDTPTTPQNLRTEIISDEYFLSWDFSHSGNERIAVYVSDTETEASAIIQTPSNLQQITFANSLPLSDLVISASSSIVATAVSATGRESAPLFALPLDVDIPLVELLAPSEADTVAQDALLSWSSELSVPEYQVQIASNISFSNVLYTSGWTSGQELSLDSVDLAGETNYFWRVRAKTDVTGPYAGARLMYTGFPEIPTYLTPGNLSQNVSTTPTFAWEASETTEEIHVQISRSSSFLPIDLEESLPAAGGSGKLSAELDKESWYYVRLAGSNDFGTSEYGSYVSFQTTAGEIPEVTLLAPADQLTVSSEDYLEWETSANQGTITYQLEIGADAEFKGIYFRTEWISESEFKVEDMGIEGKRTYFWRVKGKSEFGESEYSDSRSFTAGYPTRPKITEPAHLSEGVNARPVLGWIVDADADSIYVEFSTFSDFSSLRHSQTMLAATGPAQISGSLKGYTWYYCRIKAINSYGRSVYSAVRYFKTGLGTALDSEVTGNSLLKVFPTPFTKGRLQISYPARSASPMHLQILDQLGREIYHEITEEPLKQSLVDKHIEYERFPGPGLYLISISQDSQREVQTIVVF
jgi:uncharacterized lipoprotein YddW (UPF0748 family)